MKKKLNIIYEDKELIVINKPSGVLSVSTEKEKINTLYREVSDYEKTKFKSNKVFIVSMLDKDTSGIVVFAKNQKLKLLLQNNWNNIVKSRNYIAVVEGITDHDGTIKNYLSEHEDFVTYVSDKKHGKLAITSYTKIKNNRKYSMLNISVFTNNKHQVRVQLKDIHHGIVGDKKYGSKIDPIKRLMLHANKLVLEHPINHKMYIFECPAPREFEKIF